MEAFAPKCRGLSLRPITFAAAALIAMARILPATAQTAPKTANPPAAAQPATPSCVDQPEMTFTAWTSTLGQRFGGGAREYIFADGYFCPDTDQKFRKFLTQNPPKAPKTIVVFNSEAATKKAYCPKRFCRRLHKIENFFCRIKDWRRIATRYENFLAAADLGGAFCWVKL
jgi:hypothetical protein